MWITDLIGRVVNALFPRVGIEKALGQQVAVSQSMENAIQLWSNMYADMPPWKGANCKTMNLPSSIAHEFARLITLENEISVTGSPLADFLDKQLKSALKDFDSIVELYCAKGGIAMKPYVNGNSIEVDFTQAESFYPTDYDSNRKITGAIFIDTYKSKHYMYTRLEIHKFSANQTVKDENGVERITNTYTVTNKAYRSERLFNYSSDDDLFASVTDPLHEECQLSDVPQWASLSPSETIYDVERPLFVYVKVPSANNVDTKSPLGASVYSRAVDAIQNCDEQYSETKYEFEAFEAAIDADADLFKKQKDGTPILPAGRERVFRSYETRNDGSGQPLLKEFAPAFRDASLFNGLDRYLKVVEFLVELSYGTLSDPNSVEKTAEEIKTSKQRSYSAVCKMQSAWDEALHELVYSMGVLAVLYGLAPYGAYDLNATWGDGILEDIDKEYQRRWNQVVAGKYKLEKFYAWYYGISEEEALDLIPTAQAMPREEF